MVTCGRKCRNSFPHIACYWRQCSFSHVLFLPFDSRGLEKTAKGAELDEMTGQVKTDPGGHFLEACEKLCIWSISLPADRCKPPADCLLLPFSGYQPYR